MYRKIKKEALIKNGVPEWNSTLVEHIADQLHGGTYEYTVEDIARLPAPVQHLHYLWRAQCAVGGSGLEGFLSQAPAHEIIGIRTAFVEVGADKLLGLMDKAIALARNEFCEFRDEVSGTEKEVWFAQFKEKGEFNSLSDLDEKESPAKLVYKPLDELTLKYIEENISAIAE